MMNLLSVRPARWRAGEVWGCWYCRRLVLAGFSAVGLTFVRGRHETVEGCPARIFDLTRLSRAGICEALTRLGVETRAILAADRLKRKRQHHGVSNDRFTIHVIIVNLVVESVVTRIREKLLKLDLDRVRDWVEASHALC